MAHFLSGVYSGRAMLAVMDEHAGRRYFDEVCRRAKQRSVVLPQTLRRMLEAAAREPIVRGPSEVVQVR